MSSTGLWLRRITRIDCASPHNVRIRRVVDWIIYESFGASHAAFRCNPTRVPDHTSGPATVVLAWIGLATRRRSAATCLALDGKGASHLRSGCDGVCLVRPHLPQIPAAGCKLVDCPARTTLDIHFDLHLLRDEDCGRYHLAVPQAGKALHAEQET